MGKGVPRAVIKTKEVVVSELTTLADQFLRAWFNDHDSDFAGIVLAAMAVVEKYSSTIATLSSKDKFAAAETIIPIVIDIAVSAGKLSKEDGEALKQKMAISMDLVKALIETYILVSNNPSVIQAQEYVEDKAQKCWKSCTSKCSKK